jgi:hypothetical protein
MSNVANDLAINWKVVGEEKCLYFRFEGVLTRELAKKGIDQWEKSLEGTSAKTTLIWDCLNMKNYEPMARNDWQMAIKNNKSKMDIIWVVTDSTIIKAGAKLMGIFTSYNFKVVSSFSELENKISVAA